MAMNFISMIRNNLIQRGCRNVWSSNSRLVNYSSTSSNETQKDDSKGFSQSSSHESDEEYESKIKVQILNESLKFVPEYGWSKEAISAGAESINYPGVAHGLFPNGGADLIQYFNTMCNQRLNEELSKNIDKSKETVLQTKPEVVIQEAVRKRIELLIPYKHQWPQALAIMAMPSNVSTSFSNITTLVDNICYYAGDRSVNMNWYARRIGLIGIYKSTELYMLQDSSEDHKNTWNFLNRRIQDAVELNKVTNLLGDLPQPEQCINQVKDISNAVFGTVRNVLGCNWKKYN